MTDTALPVLYWMTFATASSDPNSLSHFRERIHLAIVRLSWRFDYRLVTYRPIANDRTLYSHGFRLPDYLSLSFMVRFAPFTAFHHVVFGIPQSCLSYLVSLRKNSLDELTSTVSWKTRWITIALIYLLKNNMLSNFLCINLSNAQP